MRHISCILAGWFDCEVKWVCEGGRGGVFSEAFRLCNLEEIVSVGRCQNPLWVVEEVFGVLCYEVHWGGQTAHFGSE